MSRVLFLIPVIFFLLLLQGVNYSHAASVSQNFSAYTHTHSVSISLPSDDEDTSDHIVWKSSDFLFLKFKNSVMCSDSSDDGILDCVSQHSLFTTNNHLHILFRNNRI